MKWRELENGYFWVLFWVALIISIWLSGV